MKNCFKDWSQSTTSTSRGANKKDKPRKSLITPDRQLGGNQIENTRCVSFDTKFTRQDLSTHVDIARLAEQFNMRSQSRAW